MNYKNCYLYIDAGYVRGRLEQGKFNEEFNPERFVQYVTSEPLYGAITHVIRKFYYDAVDKYASQEKQREQEVYLDKVRSLRDTHVVLGEVRKSNKKEQKGVDVRLAVDALESARLGLVDVIAILAGDADFVPLVEAIRRVGPHVFILAFNSCVSKDLKNAADRYYALPEDDHNLPQFSIF